MTADHVVPGLSESLPDLEATLAADPSSRNTVRVAEALRMAGETERAVALLEPLTEREPTRISPLVLLAWCFEDLGEVERAQTTLDQVKSLDPGNPFARAPEPAPPEIPFGTSPFVAEEPRAGEETPAAQATAALDASPPEVASGEPARLTELAEPAEPPEPAEAAPPAEPAPSAGAAQPAVPTPPAEAEPSFPSIRGDTEWEAEPEHPLTEQELRDVPPSPLYSATLAEIFERQGFEEKAIEIYEEVVRLHPERTDLRARIADLRQCVAKGPTP